MNDPQRTGSAARTIAEEILLPGTVEPDGLVRRERELAPPGPGEALVAVDATGVSFAEQQMRRGKYFDQPPFPFVPGYDLVGTVSAVGPGVPADMVGRRYAATTKTGAWADRLVLDAADLVPVPADVDPADAEALVVNGVTAYRMLHHLARVRPGQTVLVHGANGGVGTVLVQLARLAGADVIGTASPRHHDAVRALGAEPVDYRPEGLAGRVRALAPHGVDAVFDHVGGPGIVGSFRLLRRGGTLVSYGSAATRDVPGSSHLPILALFGRLALWSALPNRRRAHFFNLWAGLRNRATFRARLAADLGRVLELLADGAIDTNVAARLPLSEAAAAMKLAESRTVTGKVVLIPGLSGQGR